MAKLALYFHDTDSPPRILDSETAPTLDDEGYPIWQIGRPGAGASIIFDDRTVSRRQAEIRCYQVTGREQWQIQHSYLAKNASYKEAKGGDRITLPAGQWLNINDFDRFYFVTREHGFTATTAIDETMQSVEDDGPPTVNETAKAIATAPPAAAPTHPPQPWPYELGMVILNGPEGFPNWLWWLLLFGAALFVSWLYFGD